MPCYFDSGNGQAGDYLGQWLDINLVPGITSFRGQFGYSRMSALAPYRQVLANAAKTGGDVRFVIGANEGNLSADDVRGVLEIVEGTANGSLVVVRYDNALFHPKTLHLARQDGSMAVVIGSANLTRSGLGCNVEAMVTLDTRDADDLTVIQAVADAIDRWNGVTDGVFPVKSQQDVKTLVDDGIINVPLVRKLSTSIKTRKNKRSKLGKRKQMWMPSASTRPITSITAHPPIPSSAPIAAANAPSGFTRWCKKLNKFDAQHASAHPSGKLRLSKAKFKIDLLTAFRQDLFGTASWQPETRLGKTYDVANIDFDVTVRENPLGTLTLMVDHAEHRVAGQSNVPTVLAWGTQLNQTLRASNYVGDWVIIERGASGKFLLTIQSAKPSWSP